MTISLKDLRSLAELNLGEDCYKTYLAIIEPNIKSMVLNTLEDWRMTESNVTQMVMKSRGVYKGEYVFIQLGDDASEKFPEEVDADLFNEIKMWGFKRKISYLKKEGIIPTSVYAFLANTAEIRNRLHNPSIGPMFSEEDLLIFQYANSLTDQVHLVYMGRIGDSSIETRIRSNVEVAAKHLLQRFAPPSKTSTTFQTHVEIGRKKTNSN